MVDIRAFYTSYHCMLYYLFYAYYITYILYSGTTICKEHNLLTPALAEVCVKKYKEEI